VTAVALLRAKMEILVFVLLLIIFGLALVLELFGLYGNLIIMFASLVYAFFTNFQVLTMKVICLLFVLYLAGEALEFFLVMVGARRFGATRQAALAAVVGGIVGALLALFLGGIGAIPGALFGIFLGPFLVELKSGRDLVQSARAGSGSLLGRLGAIIAKVVICLVMISVAAFALWGGRGA